MKLRELLGVCKSGTVHIHVFNPFTLVEQFGDYSFSMVPVKGAENEYEDIFDNIPSEWLDFPVVSMNINNRSICIQMR